MSTPDPYAIPDPPPIPASTENALRSLTDATHPYGEALDWLLGHGDSMITEGLPGGVKDCAKAYEAGDKLAMCKLLIMVEFHREPWLYDRMGFHALAGIQEWARSKGLTCPERKSA